jgi:hypothetical protein
MFAFARFELFIAVDPMIPFRPELGKLVLSLRRGPICGIASDKPFATVNRLLMNINDNLTFNAGRLQNPMLALVRRFTTLASLALAATLAPMVLASENVPHRPYAQWADLPERGQFVFGFVYEESEAYHIWASGQQHNVTVKPPDGESYGIDINQGYFALQYGITEKWALDLNVGATTAAWRSFSPNQQPQSTTGLMDWSFGARYQIFNEARETDSAWTPTLTFRAGAVLPGTYDESFIFAPGVRSAAIEPELLLRKHFGWPGLGAYGDTYYRWNRTTGNDQYMVAVGLFQQIKAWELDVGYRHMQTISGSDIIIPDPNNLSTIVYPRAVREINDSIEAGFSYTTSKHHWRYGFNTRTVFAGNNTDRKFWIGGSIDIPIGGRHEQ